MQTELLPLRDVHLPEPVSWWPLAPGWWVLIAVFVIVALLLGHRFRKAYKQGAARRAALRDLQTLHTQYRKDGNAQAFAAAMSSLLRRAMLAYAPRADVAGLTGEAWLQWLDQDFGLPQFDTDIGRRLLDLPYRRAGSDAAAAEVERLLEIVQRRLQTPLGSAG